MRHMNSMNTTNPLNTDQPRRGPRRRPSLAETVGPAFVRELASGRGRAGRFDDQDVPRGRGGRGRRGHGGPGFGGPHRGGGRGRPRGDVRAAILLLLAEGPRHGYQLIQDISDRSNGAWTPSAGSVYPTLQALEDEGLVSIEPIDGRKTAALTAAGQDHVTEHAERLGTPWANDRDGENTGLRDAMIGLAEASKQVFRVGTADQQRRAAQTLTQARTAIYRILAEVDES